MYKKQRVAVVIPAYREELILPRTLSKLPAWIDHIIVVDDASPDRTAQVADDFARRDHRVELIRLSTNQGVGRAICTGYKRALSLRADIAVVMAADDQMDPDDLPAVLDPIDRDDADYVKGNRLAHPEWRRMPPVRRLGTRALATLTAIISGYHDLQDTQCGYTAIRCDLLQQLPLDSLYPRYGYPNDLILQLAEHNARLAQPPVRPVYADEISGLRISRVIAPISGILLRGAIRRVTRRRHARA